MNLSNFNSCFEIVATLNIAYVGVKIIRESFDEEIGSHFDLFTISNAINRLSYLIDKKHVVEGKIGEQDEKILQRFRKNHFLLHQRSPKMFKAIFWMSGLFSLCVLVLAGYEEDLGEDITSFLLASLTLLSLLYNLVVFFAVFKPKLFFFQLLRRTLNRKHFKWFAKVAFRRIFGVILISATILICAGVLFLKKEFNLSDIILIPAALLTSIFSFVLYSLKLLTHKNYYDRKVRRAIRDLMETVTELEKNNKSDVTTLVSGI